MCGIAGYISDGPRNGRDMIQALQHRGPDSTGSYSASIHGRDVFLGHTRLSIVDLSEAGHQPMTTAGDEVIIVYNGEVYNYKELRQKYLSDYYFQSNTDTEVILYLYYELGLDFVKELNGDFAIAILDRRIGRCFLIRDRLGVKPLYYMHRDGCFAFGSEIKSFNTLFPEKRLSESAIQSYFVFKYVPGNETLFSDVKRLPPGSMAVYDIASHTLEVDTYWTLRRDPSIAKNALHGGKGEFV